MKNNFLKLVVISCSFLLFGCGASRPTPQQLTSANYGERPKNIESLITDHVKETLIDPDSMKNLKIGQPQRGWTLTNYGKTILYGYWVRYSLNAKNRFGGYTGQQQQCAFIINDRIDQSWSEGDCDYFIRVVE